MVTAVGPEVDESLVGRRVAAVVKTGGWATHAMVDAGHLVPVRHGLDAAEAETVVLNGITAWQMLKKAKVDSGQTILVHGANGGVETPSSSLPATLASGSSAPPHHVTTTPSGQWAQRRLTTTTRTLPTASGGSRQVGSTRFSTKSVVEFRAVVQASCPRRDARGLRNGQPAGRHQQRACLGHGCLQRLGLWNLMPNGRRALFYNFWGGKVISPKRFWRRLAADLSSVFSLLAKGAITPQVVGPLALTDAGAAMSLAESRTAYGKVVLIP